MMSLFKKTEYLFIEILWVRWLSYLKLDTLFFIVIIIITIIFLWLLLDGDVTTWFPARRCYSPDSRGAEFWSQDKFYGSFFISFQITFAFRLWPFLQSISAYQNGAQNTIYMIGNNLLLPMKWLLKWENFWRK